jgi:hypothetical protein
MSWRERHEDGILAHEAVQTIGLFDFPFNFAAANGLYVLQEGTVDGEAWWKHISSDIAGMSMRDSHIRWHKGIGQWMVEWTNDLKPAKNGKKQSGEGGAVIAFAPKTLRNNGVPIGGGGMKWKAVSYMPQDVSPSRVAEQAKYALTNFGRLKYYDHEMQQTYDLRANQVRSPRHGEVNIFIFQGILSTMKDVFNQKAKLSSAIQRLVKGRLSEP